MKISTIVGRIRGQVKENFPDSVLSNRQAWNHFRTAAFQYMDRDKRNLYMQDIFETVDIKTEEVNLLEESCVPLDCIVCRFKVPDNFQSKMGLIYKYIASPDLSLEFDLVNPIEYTRKQGIRGNKQKYAFMENNYIYIQKCLPCVRISYLPADGVQDADGDSCSKLDQEAAVPDYLLQVCITEAVNQLQLFVQKQFDHASNKDTTS